jgi:hypothetical protein
MGNNNKMAEIIEEEYRPNSENNGEDSPETTSLVKILRRKRAQEIEKLEAKGPKRMSHNFSRY